MDRSSEDALWRAIVENYGERPDLDAQHPTPTVDGTADDTEEPTGGATGAADVADRSDTAITPDEGGVAPGTAGPDNSDSDGSDGSAGSDHAAARAADEAARAREFEVRHEVPDRFVPPEPPPLPYVAPARLTAWAALVGGPLLLVLSLAFGLPLTPFWKMLAALAFVGGFVYLVVSMPRDPREPWDDGARV